MWGVYERRLSGKVRQVEFQEGVRMMRLGSWIYSHNIVELEGSCR